MKVVLFTLNGSWVHTSLALRCLRQPLEREGFEVVLIEHTLRDRSLHVLEDLYAQQADIYGFSCYIWNLEAMLSIGAALHSILPNAKMILGGPEVSFATERFASLGWIDAIVCGEGEEAMPLLCKQMQTGLPHDRIVQGSYRGGMQDEGILYRADEGNGGILYYESSRGCPYNCAYCLSSATRGVRMKSVEQTLSDLLEFERLHSECKIIKFVDRTFNANVKRANAIWQALLDDRFSKHYHFEVCASLLDEESFAVLSQFPKGKIQLEFGLQSTNPETLVASSRHIDPTRVIEAVKRIRDFGNIHVHLDLIAGLPYESYARFAKSFDDAYGCCDLLQLGFLKLLYGTELRERSAEYGYQCLPHPPYTVLQSKWISYPELQRLSHMAETLERYLESGRFAHALWYLTPLMRSPFAFWEGLTDYLREHDARPLQKISQPDTFRYLLQYANGLDGVEAETLKEMLATDFLQHEHKNPPCFLKK
ncbi:MAG: DUF4080 domain-containing protein [Clostridia bacterium]|nr:DUF4080 domain-containing protein [Clostridia bacterium]